MPYRAPPNGSPTGRRQDGLRGHRVTVDRNVDVSAARKASSWLVGTVNLPSVGIDTRVIQNRLDDRCA
jgi:hypothetical protein